MKKLILLVLLFAPLLLPAQYIKKVEYYIDTDPGFGSGKEVSFIPRSDINLSFNADLSNTAPGLHTLFVRACDNFNAWSFVSEYPFYCVSGSTGNSSILEYAFDSDKGMGKEKQVVFNGEEFNQYISLSGLTDGIHTLFYRVQDEAGKWSQTSHHVFLKGIFSDTTEKQVTEIQFYVDNDPGPESRSKITPPPGNVIDLTGNLDLEGIPDGMHTLYMVAKTSSDAKSFTCYQSFYKGALVSNPEANISYIEYFIDDDPGIGKATPFIFIPGTLVQADFVPDVSKFPTGTHTLYARARAADGDWSFAAQTEIDVPPSINGTVRDVSLNDINFTLDKPVIPNCTVSLLEYPTNKVLATTVTDAEGRFYFAGTPTFKNFVISATFTRADVSQEPVTCSVMYDEIHGGTDTTILLPVDLHLQLNRYIDHLKTSTVFLSNDVRSEIPAYDINTIENTVHYWRNIRYNADEVISKMWQMALVLRFQNMLKSETPPLVSQFMGKSADFLKASATAIFVGLEMQKNLNEFGSVVDTNKVNALTILNFLELNKKFREALDDDISAALNKILNGSPYANDLKELMYEIISNIELEANIALQEGKLKLNKDEIINYIIVYIFEKLIVDRGNKMFVHKYINRTQSDVDRLNQINLQMNLGDAYNKTLSLTSSINEANKIAISESNKLKLWGDVSTIISEVADDAAEYFIIASTFGFPHFVAASRISKKVAIMFKFISPLLIGASMLPPANRYCEMINISHDWYNHLDTVTLKTKTFDHGIFKRNTAEVKTIADQYNSQLRLLMSSVRAKETDTIIWNHYINLLNLGRQFNQSIDLALKPINAAILNSDPQQQFDSLYFATLPNTINSASERLGFNFNFYAFLLHPDYSQVDSISHYAENLINVNNRVEDEIDLMYAKTAGIQVSAFVSYVGLDAPRTLVRNSTYHAWLSYSNFGTVTAERVYARVFRNNLASDSIFIGNLEPGIVQQLNFSVSAGNTDSLLTYRVEFHSDNGVAENKTFTLLCTDFSIYQESISAHGDSLFLKSGNSGIFDYQWYKDGIPVKNAITQKYTATENGDYYLKLRYGAYEQTSNVIHVSNIISGINPALPSNPQVRIFPNPTTGLFKVNVDQVREALTLEIVSVTGQVIYHEDLQKHRDKVEKTIDISAYPKGEYLLKLNGKSYSASKKIILN